MNVEVKGKEGTIIWAVCKVCISKEAQGILLLSCSLFYIQKAVVDLQ